MRNNVIRSISCAYFHSVVTKIDQLLYERSGVRIFVRLWLKSISCYMIDQLCVFLYSRGWLLGGLRYCHENFLQYFHPFTWCVMVFKKSALSCMIDTPLLPPWSIAFRCFHREWKKEKKTDTDTSGIFDKYSWGSKTHYFCHEFFFFRTEKQETYFSALHIDVVTDVTIWSVTRVWQLRPRTRLSFQITKTKTPLNQIWSQIVIEIGLICQIIFCPILSTEF